MTVADRNWNIQSRTVAKGVYLSGNVTQSSIHRMTATSCSAHQERAEDIFCLLLEPAPWKSDSQNAQNAQKSSLAVVPTGEWGTEVCLAHTQTLLACLLGWRVVQTDLQLAIRHQQQMLGPALRRFRGGVEARNMSPHFHPPELGRTWHHHFMLRVLVSMHRCDQRIADAPEFGWHCSQSEAGEVTRTMRFGFSCDDQPRQTREHGAVLFRGCRLCKQSGTLTRAHHLAMSRGAVRAAVLGEGSGSRRRGAARVPVPARLGAQALLQDLRAGRGRSCP